MVGVLDLDSPEVGRFAEEDQAGFERLARCYAEASEFPGP